MLSGSDRRTSGSDRRQLIAGPRRPGEEADTVFVMLNDGTRIPLYSESLQKEINGYFAERESKEERVYKPVAPFPAALARKEPLKSHKDILGTFRDVEVIERIFHMLFGGY